MPRCGFKTPGTYTLVAHALAYSGAFTPWSPPVTVRVFAPFDLVSNPSFSDDRGPSYKLGGTIREKAAQGKVQLRDQVRGKQGRQVPLARQGEDPPRRQVHQALQSASPGKYRLRLRYKGNGKVLPGTITGTITITRRFF